VFQPLVHGEYAFLKEHEALARECGVTHSTVIGNGTMLVGQCMLTGLKPVLKLPGLSASN
jgi:hypothetical protein